MEYFEQELYVEFPHNTLPVMVPTKLTCGFKIFNDNIGNPCRRWCEHNCHGAYYVGRNYFLKKVFNGDTVKSLPSNDMAVLLVLFENHEDALKFRLWA